MSSRYPVELNVFDLPPLEMTGSMHKLGTILGCPLFWDDAEHCPVWPEGWPKTWTREADDGITIEPCVEVHQVAWFVRQPYKLDCPHTARGREFVVTWLASEAQTCIGCAERAEL